MNIVTNRFSFDKLYTRFACTPIALKIALASVLGSFSALSMAPFSGFYILFFTFPAFYILLCLTPKFVQSSLLTFFFFFFYFVFGLSWIGNALLIEGSVYRWAWALAICGVPLILAPFPTLLLMPVFRYLDLRRLNGFFAFVAMVSLSEWLRGHLFTGFPWNLFGYAWADVLPMLQLSAIGSIYLISLFTIFWGFGLGYIYVSRRSKTFKVILLLLILSSFTAVYLYGYFRLEGSAATFNENVIIRVVQPNIAQEDKWNPHKTAENFFSLLSLSYAETPHDSQQKTVIIWPETAISERLYNIPQYKKMLSEMLRSHGRNALLITGMLRIPDASTDISYRNSVVVIDSDGEIINAYDKSHLVPFGEYIPFQRYIPIKPVVEFSGFDKGVGRVSLPIDDQIRFIPLICYEIIFPNAVLPESDVDKTDFLSRPLSNDFIINVTNDAWYGDSAGPHQHFLKARLRAIEEGIPVMRSANTGISAIISPYGQVLDYARLMKKDSIESLLPRPLIQTIAPYQKHLIFFLCIFIFLLPAFLKDYIRKT